MTAYYADDMVTLYLGDCREVTAWLEADVLVTDPPYGRNWQRATTPSRRRRQKRPDAPAIIAGDRSTAVRDASLEAWGPRPAIVFGDLTLSPPPGNKLTLVYRKPTDAGSHGAIAGFRRDAEAVYLLGPWPPSPLGGRSSVIATGARVQGSPSGAAARYGHPHAKPVDVMEQLIHACPPGVIADPFAGGGSTLVAARNLGRHSIGVEVDERYCELAARRLSQGILTMEPEAAT